jgi:hypothetical protein
MQTTENRLRSHGDGFIQFDIMNSLNMRFSLLREYALSTNGTNADRIELIRYNVMSGPDVRGHIGRESVTDMT